MDLIASLNWFVSLQSQLSESLSCLFSRIAKHILLKELIIVVASDEINTSSTEDSEHNGWFFHSVEAFHQTVGPACRAQLSHLLVRSTLCVLDPVAELADAVLVVVVAIRLEHEVVAVGENLWNEAVGVSFATHRAHR